MAQLQAQQTRKNDLQRLASKTQIARLMYRHQYDRKNVLQLLRLIDWMMALPAELGTRLRTGNDHDRTGAQNGICH